MRFSRDDERILLQEAIAQIEASGRIESWLQPFLLDGLRNEVDRMQGNKDHRSSWHRGRTPKLTFVDIISGARQYREHTGKQPSLDQLIDYVMIELNINDKRTVHSTIKKAGYTVEEFAAIIESP